MHFDVQSYLQARTKYEYIETNFPENPDIDYVKDQLKLIEKKLDLIRTSSKSSWSWEHPDKIATQRREYLGGFRHDDLG